MQYSSTVYTLQWGHIQTRDPCPPRLVATNCKGFQKHDGYTAQAMCICCSNGTLEDDCLTIQESSSSEGGYYVWEALCIPHSTEILTSVNVVNIHNPNLCSFHRTILTWKLCSCPPRQPYSAYIWEMRDIPSKDHWFRLLRMGTFTIQSSLRDRENATRICRG